MATKKRAARKVYTEEKRAEVMAAAAKEGLTAGDVEKRFGIPKVTYYSWRQKAGAAPRRAARNGHSAGPKITLDGEPIPAQVRSAIQTRVRSIALEIVSQEIEALFK